MEPTIGLEPMLAPVVKIAGRDCENAEIEQRVDVPLSQMTA
jgi:hypothetical protein